MNDTDKDAVQAWIDQQVGRQLTEPEMELIRDTRDAVDNDQPIPPLAAALMKVGAGDTWTALTVDESFLIAVHSAAVMKARRAAGILPDVPWTPSDKMPPILLMQLDEGTADLADQAAAQEYLGKLARLARKRDFPIQSLYPGAFRQYATVREMTEAEKEAGRRQYRLNQDTVLRWEDVHGQRYSGNVDALAEHLGLVHVGDSPDAVAKVTYQPPLSVDGVEVTFNFREPGAPGFKHLVTVHLPHDVKLYGMWASPAAQ